MSNYLQLTDLDIIKLIKFSYMDLSSKTNYKEYKKDIEKLVSKKTKISEISVPITEKGWIKTDGFLTNQREIMATPQLKDLIIFGHINDNVGDGNPNGSGLVAYALLNQEKNQIFFLCRGSEGGLLNISPDWIQMIKKGQYSKILKSEDWRDNFTMVFEESKAFMPLKKFIDDILKKRADENTKCYAFGHSKGGGQAMYLAANYGFFGKAIDGVGISPITLYEKECYVRNIKESKFVNLVAENDIVGVLLQHPEKTIKVKMNNPFEAEEKKVNPYEFNGFTWAHYPQAIFLDKEGMSVKGKRICLMPLIIAAINKFFMLRLMYEEMNENEKAQNNTSLVEAEKICLTTIQNYEQIVNNLIKA